MRRERRVIHVECDRLDGATFCGGMWHDGDVNHRTWTDDQSQIQRATCPDCLLKLFMLGDSAQIALARMGMKVDVHNEEEIA
mgnify:CR=1 FL=1